jgi:hypothetical protein
MALAPVFAAKDKERRREDKERAEAARREKEAAKDSRMESVAEAKKERLKSKVEGEGGAWNKERIETRLERVETEVREGMRGGRSLEETIAKKVEAAKAAAP